MLLAGVSCVIVTEIYAAVMQRVFQTLTTASAKDLPSWVFIYLWCATVGFVPSLEVKELTKIFEIDALINSTTWLYGSEVMPMSIRSRIVGVSAVSHYVVNVSSTFCLP
jgi:hypothetical protein